MEFEWDEEKRRRNIEKHGVDLADAALIFENEVLTKPDRRLDYGEERFISVGIADGHFYVVIHTYRGTKTRIISARQTGRQHYARYQKSITRRNPGDEGTR